MANFGFSTSQYDPNAGFDVLPAGDYVAMLVEADIRTNKSNTGDYINCKWLITEGEFINRTIYDAVNITHTNSMAEKIGRQRLSAIAHAIGCPEAQDTEQLIQKPCVLTLSIKRDEKYGEQNIIKKFAAYQFGLQQPPAAQGSYQQSGIPTVPPTNAQHQAPVSEQPAMNISTPGGQPVFNVPPSEQAARITY